MFEMVEIFKYTFFQHALLAGLCASILCGVVGTIVVAKQMSAISGGIAHASFGGIGLGYFLGIDPFVTATTFSLVLAGIAAILLRTLRERMDTLIAAFWAGGMALGILFISRSPGYTPDLFGYLFGNILMVSGEQVLAMVLLTFTTVIIVTLCYQELTSVIVDEEFSEVMGVPVSVYICLFLVLIALTGVMLISVVGIILVIALLTLPAAGVRWYCKSLHGMMISASCVGIGCTFFGIMCSFFFDVPTGAMIILICIVWYALSRILCYLRGYSKKGSGLANT
jgi:zinc transport system permease protein